MAKVKKRSKGQRASKPVTKAADPVDIKIRMEARVALDPIERFAAEWKMLPPLVRAAMAAGVIEYCARRGHKHTADWFRDAGLERRAKVHTWFETGNALVQRLFMGLCKQGDADAVERGVDADVGGTSEFALAGAEWQAKEIWRVERKP